MSDKRPFETEVASIQAAWEQTKPTIQANLAILEAAAPGVTADQIEEILKTVCSWANKVRSPHGFRPIFPYARLQLSLSMNLLAKNAANMAGDPATHLSAFLRQLMACLIPLSCATMFAEKNDRIRGVMEAHAELEQSIALMDTAQKELGQKQHRLEEAEAVATRINACSEQLSTIETNAVEFGDKIEALFEEAEGKVEDIKTTENNAAEVKNACDTLLAENEKLNSIIKKQLADFEGFVLKSKQQIGELNNQAKEKGQLIDSLLSGATSSALATAFSRGKKRYLAGQIIWGLGFLVAVSGLIGIGLGVGDVIPNGQEASDIWIYLAHRIPLVAPLIWLGWFCAMQYGNVIRLMEDYAFKEATSIAFAGYRDHMEHLSGVSDSEGSNALERLALVTIAVLGNEPLRLLQKQHQDTSPMDKILGYLKSQKIDKPTDDSD